MSCNAMFSMSLLCFCALIGCSETPSEPVLDVSTTFATSKDGWSAMLSDYPPDLEDDIAFSANVESLPAPHAHRAGYRLTGHNRPDDIYMFIKRAVGGLHPGATYDVHFSAEIATPYGTDCLGAGGAPGTDIWLKAGASAAEPDTALVSGIWRLNVDKGEQSEAGSQATILGNAGHEDGDCDHPTVNLKELPMSTSGIRVRADQQGRVWVFFGFESGYEGINDVYIARATARLRRRG